MTRRRVLAAGAALALGLATASPLAVSGGPAADRGRLIPHEDPAAAAADRDASLTMLLFQDAAAAVRALRLADARVLLAAIARASVPEDLQFLVEHEGGAIAEIANAIERVEAALSEAARLVRAGRRKDAAAVLSRARRLLARGRLATEDAVAGLRELAGRVGIAGLPERAPARRAYANAQGSLQQLLVLARTLAAAIARIERGDIGEVPRLLTTFRALVQTALLRTTFLRWSSPAVAYPGLPFSITGSVRAEDGLPVPRRLRVALDGGRLENTVVKGPFRLSLTVPSTTPLGPHALAVEVEAAGSYAGAAETHALEVTRAQVTVTAHGPRLAWLPGRMTVWGVASSALGFREAPTVEARLGSAAGLVPAAPGGTFRTSLDLPVSLALPGPQTAIVRVVPAEPWNAPAEADVPVFIVNVLTPGLVAAAVAPLALAGYARRRRSRWGGGPAAVGPLLPQAAAVRAASSEEAGIAVGASARTAVLALYWSAVRRIEQRTGARMLPHLTLREFQRTASHEAGPFADMTALAEAALYAPHAIGPDVVDTMQGLLRQVEAAGTREPS